MCENTQGLTKEEKDAERDERLANRLGLRTGATTAEIRRALAEKIRRNAIEVHGLPPTATQAEINQAVSNAVTERARIRQEQKS